MNIYRPTEGIDEISRQFIPTYQNIVETLQYISERYEILSLNDSLFSALLTNHSFSDPSGIDSLRILADGAISPSTYLIHNEYIVGNIRNDNVLENIDCNIAKIVYDVTPLECERCILKPQCRGGVIDRRYLWYNTLTKKDPYCMGPYYSRSLLPEKVTLSTKNFESVHDGYLPTMFFVNK
jgi:radical SAM protein with 4Fe4S-binding SPASM domain